MESIFKKNLTEQRVAVFIFIILVFTNLKSTTGLLFLVPFLATNITGVCGLYCFWRRFQKKLA